MELKLCCRRKKNHIVNTLSIGMGFKTFLQGSDQLRVKYAGDNWQDP